jgi:hypothetical protein
MARACCGPIDEAGAARGTGSAVPQITAYGEEVSRREVLVVVRGFIESTPDGISSTEILRPTGPVSGFVVWHGAGRRETRVHRGICALANRGSNPPLFAIGLCS